jgi:hypothetical protein
MVERLRDELYVQWRKSASPRHETEAAKLPILFRASLSGTGCRGRPTHPLTEQIFNLMLETTATNCGCFAISRTPNFTERLCKPLDVSQSRC